MFQQYPRSPDPSNQPPLGEQEKPDNFSALSRFLKLLPDFESRDFAALNFDPGEAVVSHAQAHFRSKRGTLRREIAQLAVARGDSVARIPKELADSIVAAEKRIGWSLLKACVESDDLTLFRRAIGAGYPVTADVEYRPPLESNLQIRSTGNLLHYAALRGAGYHALELVKAGLPLNGQDSRGHTPLSIVGFALRDRSLDISDKENFAAVFADIFQLVETASSLIASGADPYGAMPRQRTFAYSYLRWLATHANRFPSMQTLEQKLKDRDHPNPRREIGVLDTPFAQVLQMADRLGATGQISDTPSSNVSVVAQQNRLLVGMLASGASLPLVADVIDACLKVRDYQTMSDEMKKGFATILTPHLRELLHELPEKITKGIATLFDLDLHQVGVNPFEAELFAFASHPTGNSKTDFASSITLAATATYDFHNQRMRKGTWDHLRQWQIIGARNFQHLPLRLDTRKIIPSLTGEPVSLMEAFGFRPIHAGALGNGFALKLNEDEYVEFLRGGFLSVRRGSGALFIRNSSPMFDMRQILDSPAFISKSDYLEELKERYGKASIGSFVLSRNEDFAHILDIRLYRSGHFLPRLERLNETLTMALRRYHQWKCLTAHDQIWRSEEERTLKPEALYGAPGFKAVASFIREWRMQERGPLDLGWHDLSTPALATIPYIGPDGNDRYRLSVDSRLAQGIYRLATSPREFSWGEYPELRSFFQGGIASHGNLTLLNGKAIVGGV